MEKKVREEIVRFALESPENRHREGGERHFDEPLVGYASAADPPFMEYKKVIGPFHRTPRKGIGLQEDTIASVRTRGLIGDKYISLSPGASDRLIPPGGKIRETESTVDLEGLIGQFVHGSAK